MKASKSRRAIIATYDKYDRRLTVMSFDAFGNRVMTYSDYGTFAALLQAAKCLKRGFLVRIFLDLPKGQHTPTHLDKIPYAYIFDPQEVF